MASVARSVGMNDRLPDLHRVQQIHGETPVLNGKGSNDYRSWNGLAAQVGSRGRGEVVSHVPVGLFHSSLPEEAT